MTCIHGLDEINCPTCRIMKSTSPIDELNPKSNDFLEIKHPLFKNNRNLNIKLTREITAKNTEFNTPDFLSKPHFINELPDFRNELFYKRVKELDLTKEDNYKISQKISLESPEWKFEEED